MKDMMIAKKKELEERGYKGFTLMEMLIVIAIIAILVAIAIPIFTTQLENAREAADLANVRGAYAELVTKSMKAGSTTEASITVSATQRQSNWQSLNNDEYAYIGTDMKYNGDDAGTRIQVPAKTSGEYTLKLTSSNTVSVE